MKPIAKSIAQRYGMTVKGYAQKYGYNLGCFYQVINGQYGIREVGKSGAMIQQMKKDKVWHE